MNFLHENIDVHCIRLISEFLVDGGKFISKIQSHCVKMTFFEKVDMIGFSRNLHIKEGNQH